MLKAAFFLPLLLAPQARGEAEAINPRPFGYALGDVLTQEVVLSPPAGFRLDETSLPRPGRTGLWLERREARLAHTRGPGGVRYRLSLAYQIVNAPRQVQTLALPELRLRLVGRGAAREEIVAEWPFTVGPLTPETVLARAGLEAMRPDHAPGLRDTAAVRLRLALYAALLAALGLWFALPRIAPSWLAAGRRPFVVAAREIGAARRAPGAPQAALRSLHRAFDRTAGHALFAEQLPAFFAAHPAYAPLRHDIEDFYARSRAHFFGDGAAPPLEPLLDLARRCRRIERETT